MRGMMTHEHAAGYLAAIRDVLARIRTDGKQDLVLWLEQVESACQADATSCYSGWNGL